MYAMRFVPALLMIAGGLLILLVPGRNSFGQAQDGAEAKKALRKVLDEQVAAWNKGDLEGYMQGYWNSDDLIFYSGRDIIKGWKATLERFRKKYQSGGKKMGQLTLSDVEIEPLGPESALVRGRWQVILPDEKLSGLFTFVCRKLAPGWRIVHEHTS